MQPQTGITPTHAANRLGMAFRHEAHRLPWKGPIWDIHTHLMDVPAAEQFFEVADWFGIERVWTMSPLDQVDALRERFGDRLEFTAVPNYAQRQRETTFTTDWLRAIEAFADKGARICKFWAAPRGRDFHPALQLDHPIRIEGMKIARDVGMIFMTHVADPDTWFATHYADGGKYGTKRQQYEPLRRMLAMFDDVPWIAAHMGGSPEDLDFLQQLLDQHPNLYVDTSATKWMVRELSKHPRAFADFCVRNAGRVIFGSDNVAASDRPDASTDLYASRYWALRAMLETDYEGQSPIADPDLHMLDPTVPADAAPPLRGAQLPPETLASVYRGAAAKLLPI